MLLGYAVLFYFLSQNKFNFGSNFENRFQMNFATPGDNLNISILNAQGQAKDFPQGASI